MKFESGVSGKLCRLSGWCFVERALNRVFRVVLLFSQL